MIEPVPESQPVPEQDATAKLQESAGQAWAAAFKALYAFVLVLLILVGRTLQALFVLARPAVLVATIVAAGCTSVMLFGTVLVHYGGGLPAIVLALAAIVIVPATLVILAGDYGIWAVCLAVAVLEFLAHLGLQRAPPMVLALVPVLALATTILAILFTETTNEEVPNEKGQRDISPIVDSVGGPDLVHDNQDL